METKVITKKTVVKKAKAVEVDPFAVVVDETPVKKRVAKKAVAAAKVEAKPVKKPVRKTSKTVVLDPFAEVVKTASPVKKRAATTVKAAKKVTEPKIDLSPAFKVLAEPALPELQRENRARLLMQTPTRLYFYWSVRENPWATLRNVFGDDLGSYSLVLKLTDVKRGAEEIHPAEAEGNWWFNVEPDGEYQAEIGFYAPNRPYFRIIYSNTVETPRRSPSKRSATEAKWTVTANKFAEVLDVAGFSRDAFDVAMAGDDHESSENATHIAFSRFVGAGEYEFNSIAAEDIRYAMIALASGATLEDLRFRVGPALFAILQANADKLEAARAMSALTEYFDIDEAEFTEEQFSSAVYGASLVNFPRTLKTRSLSPKFAPVSSHSLR